jgi:hypothetical protein
MDIPALGSMAAALIQVVILRGGKRYIVDGEPLPDGSGRDLQVAFKLSEILRRESSKMALEAIHELAAAPMDDDLQAVLRASITRLIRSNDAVRGEIDDLLKSMQQGQPERSGGVNISGGTVTGNIAGRDMTISGSASVFLGAVGSEGREQR